MLYILFRDKKLCPHCDSERGGCVIVVHFVSYDSNVFVSYDSNVFVSRGA